MAEIAENLETKTPNYPAKGDWFNFAIASVGELSRFGYQNFAQPCLDQVEVSSLHFQ